MSRPAIVRVIDREIQRVERKRDQILDVERGPEIGLAIQRRCEIRVPNARNVREEIARVESYLPDVLE